MTVKFSPIGMHGDAQVRSIGPVLPSVRVQQIGLGFEIAGLGEGQFKFPAVAIFLHGHIAPAFAGERGADGVGGDDFLAAGGGAAKVRAQKGAGAVFLRGIGVITNSEKEPVADETKDSFAGGGRHDWPWQFHRQSFKVSI
jgi:hypothetical protein